ncbi:tetratricopeptide repeat protein [candidate division KSB1 bacterium]|nr:tetratricopeptide repeat protein [candidate division KSB1 bacterium]
MKRFHPIILFIFLVLLTTQCAYYNTFHNARKFYKQAENERKKREKTQVVELSPEEEEQLKKMGQSGVDTKSRASQQEMQNYQQAIERASRVLEYYPESRWVDDALLLLGRCFYYRRDFKKAMRKFDEILQLYPDSDFIPETLMLKARTYIGLEEYDTAEEELHRLANDVEIPKAIREEAKFELGGLYYKKQNYDLAAENFQSSAKSADDKLIKAMAQYRLGDCLMRLKQYEEAPDVLRRAIKAAPNDDFLLQAMFKLGQAYSLSGEYDKAIKNYKTALAKEFDEKRIPRIKLELATNLRLDGKLSEAIKWYDNIIEEHKRTDASARSYFALGEIQEYIVDDLKKAKENYDLVRSEFSSSLIAPIAQQRSDNIRTLQELQDDIARLEGRYVETDSLGNITGDESRIERDDGPIDLSMDGMWVNYSGRDRPPPLSLRELTDADLARQAVMQERIALMKASGDSSKIDDSLLMPAQLDSAALARQAEQEAKEKNSQLSGKYLALAEIFLFAFDKPDSAIKYYQTVVEKRADSTRVARALYSLAYIYRDFKDDSVLADTVLAELIDIFPQTAHAEGARKILGVELMKDRVDSARILYEQAEEIFFKDNDLHRAFQLWDAVATKFPQSEYAQKAAYAKAWHYEHTLYKLEDAIDLYQALVDSFPQSPYATRIKSKLAAVDKVRQDEETKQKAIADSLAKLQQPAPDTTATDSLSDGISPAVASDTSAVETAPALTDTSDVIPPMDAENVQEQAHQQPAVEDEPDSESDQAAGQPSLDKVDDEAEIEDQKDDVPSVAPPDTSQGETKRPQRNSKMLE